MKVRFSHKRRTIISLIIRQRQELDLIRRALWAGPGDQSLWFYHQNLMVTFRIKDTATSIVPNLTGIEKLNYLRKEIDEIQEIFECADDCKFAYQTLIDLGLLYQDLTELWPRKIISKDELLDKLIELDPVRSGRWVSLKGTLS